MEQLVSLLGLFNPKGFHGLERLVQIEELLLPSFLCSRSLIFKEVEIGTHFPLHCHQCCEGFLDLGGASLLFHESEDGNDMDKVFLIVPSAVGWHLELGAVRQLDLDLLCFLSFV